MNAPERLRGAGALTLAALPLAMAAANRSSPAVMALSAVLFLAAALVEDRGAALATLVAPLRTATGLVALAFLGWCGLSLAWSPFPALSLRTAGEFGPTLFAAYLVARLAPGRMPPGTALAAAWMLGLAGLYIVADLAADLPVQKAIGARVAYFIFNRPVLTILLVVGPLVALLVRRGHRLAAGLTSILGVAAILCSVSGAATLGFLAGTALALAAWLLPRRAGLGLAGSALALAVILAPVEGDLLHRLMPEAAHERLVQSSSRARVAIARSFGAAVAADPWRGAGYGTAGRFAHTPVTDTIAPDWRGMLAVGHPHNSFLQVWAELGIVGAGLLAALLFLLLRTLAALPRFQAVTALGLVGAAIAVAFVEHGAWQGWWVAGLGAAVTWLREGWSDAA
ncbi:O-antigen ligase family protein [Methylobacterium gossipiicola]|uniref:O-antigen ligase n=1 Tax=Methylobacterium gossipiicola TaxID=582675 RepID=A0A1I2VXA8_9HYPH|nr:O-antigen ligase family protein [Methylobacterium gossipiicola]SFG92406.1 O-antigen ligase [Methylobacterium gossipiicola]